MARLAHKRLLALVAGLAFLLSGCSAAGEEPIRPGMAAPILTVTTLAGAWSEVRPEPGHPLWLSFWASWCYPCRVEWPDLNQAQQNLAGEAVTIVAISVNEPASVVARFLAERPVSFDVVLDPEGQIAARYGVIGFPTHVLIDGAGVVRQIVRGPLNETRAREIFGLTERRSSTTQQAVRSRT
jgi:thiol-disulfide isomerase/thioredoxin